MIGKALSREIYRRCLEAAGHSPCQKLRFGCTMTVGNEILRTTFNDTNPARIHECQPTCIRLGITSRTQQDLGACDHAEEIALRELAASRISPGNISFFIAGITPGGVPLVKATPEFTCSRCATQLVEAGLRDLNVFFNDEWVSLPPKTALEQAQTYQLGNKKIVV